MTAASEPLHHHAVALSSLVGHNSGGDISVGTSCSHSRGGW